MKKRIIIGVVLLLLIGGGAGGFFLMQSDEPADAAAEAGAEGEGETAAAEEEAQGDPLYLPLSPAFVVNFEHKGGIRYLQLNLQIMSYEQEVIDKVEANSPAVRNALIMLFSGQDYDALNTIEGKESLRLAVRESINDVVKLTSETGVNDVFFTGFVMQ